MNLGKKKKNKNKNISKLIPVYNLMVLDWIGYL